MGNNMCHHGLNNTHILPKYCMGKQKKVYNSVYLNEGEKQIWLSRLAIKTEPLEVFWNENSSLTHACFKQIQKDISRTFWTSHYFANKQNEERFGLLLKKFAIYFPKVGYTQGLNFLAGYLLIMGFNDDQAFEALVKITTHHQLLIIGLYEDNFPLNNLFCAVFWQLLSKRMPAVATKIKQSKVPDQAWIFQWFMSFFLYSFPVQFVRTFIDYIISHKQFAMVALALGVVKCLKNDINKMQSFDEFDFYFYFDGLKTLEFCEQKISITKTISYANSVSDQQIKEALQQCYILSDNFYYRYFKSDLESRLTIWKNLMEKLKNQRNEFKINSNSPNYCRKNKEVSHLSRFLHRNSSFYLTRTDSIDTNKIATLNFAIDLILQEQDQFEQTCYQRSFPQKIQFGLENLSQNSTKRKKKPYEDTMELYFVEINQKLRRKEIQKASMDTLSEKSTNSNF